MLREIRDVAPDADGQRRRWFTSDYFDLFLFYHHDHIAGFQFCYDKPGSEHVLQWSGGNTFRHSRVDAGDATPHVSASPIFVDARHPFPPQVLDRFRAESRPIDPTVRGLVLYKLEQFLRS